MTTSDPDDRDLLDSIDSTVREAIRGAVWFPFVFLPNYLKLTLPNLIKVSRVLGLFLLWVALVFGPLALLDGVPEFAVFLIFGWTALTFVGSALAVVRRVRRHAKPAGFAEVYV